MPKIYDNIENHLTKGLNESLEVSQRTDFCVGYFNLRGWKEIAEKIDSLSGETVNEGKDDFYRICRLLVGYKKNSNLKEKVSKKTGNITYQEFYPRLSKPIID